MAEGISAARPWPVPPAPRQRPRYREGSHVALPDGALPFLHAEVLEDVQVRALPGCWYRHRHRWGDGTPTPAPPVTPGTGGPADRPVPRGLCSVGTPSPLRPECPRARVSPPARASSPVPPCPESP